MGVVYGFSRWQDGDMRWKANRNRFLESLDVPKSISVRAEQIHGAEIVRVNDKHTGRVIPGADGLVTTARGIFLAVLAADCIPALFYNPKRKVVATAHLGWRGLAAELAPKIVEFLANLGSRPEDLNVVLGPSICAKYYEVQRDLVNRFAEIEEAVFISRGGKTFFDLRNTARNQLLDSGIPKANVKIDPRCTFEDPHLYSWRRERPKLSGLFAGFIGIA
jgi:YfiH family protein